MPGIKVDDPPDDDELAELKFEEEQVDDPSVVESSSNRDKNKVRNISMFPIVNFVLSSREIFVQFLGLIELK